MLGSDETGVGLLTVPKPIEGIFLPLLKVKWEAGAIVYLFAVCECVGRERGLFVEEDGTREIKKGGVIYQRHWLLTLCRGDLIRISTSQGSSVRTSPGRDCLPYHHALSPCGTPCIVCSNRGGSENRLK